MGALARFQASAARLADLHEWSEVTLYAPGSSTQITATGKVRHYSDHLVGAGAAQIDDRQVVLLEQSVSASIDFEPGVAVVHPTHGRMVPTRWKRSDAGVKVVGHVDG